MAEGEAVDPEWWGYECKAGQILFYYNKTTGEHIWAGGDQIPKAKQDENDPDLCGYGCKSGEILFHYNKTTGEHRLEGGDQENSHNNTCQLSVSGLQTTSVKQENENPLEDGSCFDETNEEPLPSTPQLSQEQDNETGKGKPLEDGSCLDETIEEPLQSTPQLSRNRNNETSAGIKKQNEKEAISLTNHQRLHTGAKPYERTYCSKEFPLDDNLNIHERIHSGVKSFKCTYCNKAFTQKAHLKRHERIHSGVKPYKCTYCNKAFYRSYHLKRHERIHSGVKPYKCTYCEKPFAEQGNVKRHERRIHTSVKPYTASVHTVTRNLHEKSHLKGQEHFYSDTRPLFQSISAS